MHSLALDAFLEQYFRLCDQLRLTEEETAVLWERVKQQTQDAQLWQETHFGATVEEAFEATGAVPLVELALIVKSTTHATPRNRVRNVGLVDFGLALLPEPIEFPSTRFHHDTRITFCHISDGPEHETEKICAAMDGVVFLIEGVNGLTLLEESVWHVADRHALSRIVVTRRHVGETLDGLRRFDNRIFPVPVSLEPRFKKDIRDATLEGRIIPLLYGGDVKNKDEGVIWDAVIDYLPSPVDLGRGNDREPFRARPFKIMHDDHLGKVVALRAESGYCGKGGLFEMHANKRVEVKEILAGDIVLAFGWNDLILSLSAPEPVITVDGDREDCELPQRELSKLMHNDPAIKWGDTAKHATRCDRVRNVALLASSVPFLSKRKNVVGLDIGLSEINFPHRPGNVMRIGSVDRFCFVDHPFPQTTYHGETRVTVCHISDRRLYEAENICSAVDGGISIIHGQTGVTLGEERLWEIANRQRLPRIAVILENFREALAQLQRLDDRVVPLYEQHYFGGSVSDDAIKNMIREATLQGRMIPVIYGGDYSIKNMTDVLDAVVDYLPSPSGRGRGGWDDVALEGSVPVPEPIVSVEIRVKDPDFWLAELAKLMKEDPTIKAEVEQRSRKIKVAGMSEQHVRRAVARIAFKFNRQVALGKAVAIRKGKTQPVMDVEVVCSRDQAHEVTLDLERRRAKGLSVNASHGITVIRARAPLGRLLGYNDQLPAGAACTILFRGYEEEES